MCPCATPVQGTMPVGVRGRRRQRTTTTVSVPCQTRSSSTALTSCHTKHNRHEKTSRDRPKSAPYLRLKNRKRTSKCPSILFYSTQKNLFSEKNLTMPKKLKGGTLWDFSTSILSQNSKKIEGGPFGGKKFRKKVAQYRKKLKGRPDPLVSSGIVLYGERRKNLLGSVLRANGYNLKFCRTFGRTILVTSGVSKKNTDEKP